MTNPTGTQIDQQNDTSRIRRVQADLEQREDFVGQTYRTIRDNPKTSAAIGAGVVAAAGAGAFLLNRKNSIGTATGHARPSDEIVGEVGELNEETVSKLNQKESKAGSVAY